MDFQKRIVPECAPWQVEYERKKVAEARAIAAGEIEDPKAKKRWARASGELCSVSSPQD